MSLSRREFAKLSALGLAAQLTPRIQAQPQAATAPPAAADGRKIGYCVIGLGRIASHFMPAARSSSTSQITAVVSGHRDKAERIAAEYGIPTSSIYNYENMDAIRDNKSIDAVYVALPNSMHAEYTIRSAKAGKHVLCEKPMSTTVADAKAMIDACKAANVKLMIAYRCHYEPSNLQAVKLIRDGALGQVQTITSSFGFNIARGEWRVNKKLAGGGPLFDVGIYALNATRYLTGEEPSHLSGYTSTITHDGRFDEVEENTSWATKFPSGILATCNCTYGANMEGIYRVYGTKGWLELTPAFSYEGLRLRAHYSNGTKGDPGTNIDQLNPERDPIHFVREADHFSNCIRQNLTPKTPGEEGLRDMEYIQQIYRSAGVTML